MSATRKYDISQETSDWELIDDSEDLTNSSSENPTSEDTSTWMLVVSEDGEIIPDVEITAAIDPIEPEPTILDEGTSSLIQQPETRKPNPFLINSKPNTLPLYSDRVPSMFATLFHYNPSNQEKIWKNSTKFTSDKKKSLNSHDDSTYRISQYKN